MKSRSCSSLRHIDESFLFALVLAGLTSSACRIVSSEHVNIEFIHISIPMQYAQSFHLERRVFLGVESER